MLGTHVNHRLWVPGHARDQFRERFARFFHHGEYLQGADKAITGRRLVQHQHVPGRLAANDSTRFAQHLEDIAITYSSAPKIDVPGLERMLQTQITHDRTDDRSLEVFLVLARRRHYVKQLVSIHQRAALIDHDNAVTIAVHCHTDVSFYGGNGYLQKLRLRRAAGVIDILAIRRAADWNHLGPQAHQCARADFVAGAICAIESDLQAFEIYPVGHAVDAKVLVANTCRIDALGLAQRLRLQGNRTVLQMLFDLAFHLIVQLRTRAVEEFDAIIEKR